MTRKAKRFKEGGSTPSKSPLQKLDYNLLSGGNSGFGGGRDFRMSPTVIKTPAPYMGSTAGAPPKAYGVTLKKRFKEGGKASVAEAVHNHERAKHKGQPLTKLAKGGAASKRADGCCSKGKTKGKMV